MLKLELAIIYNYRRDMKIVDTIPRYFAFNIVIKRIKCNHFVSSSNDVRFTVTSSHD